MYGNLNLLQACFLLNLYSYSLNSGYCRQVQKEIDEDNQQLVRRLQNANSQYSQRNFSQANKKYDKMKTNIAFSRMDPFYDL